MSHHNTFPLSIAHHTAIHTSAPTGSQKGPGAPRVLHATCTIPTPHYVILPSHHYVPHLSLYTHGGRSHSSQLVPTCPIPPTLGSPDPTQPLHAPYSLPGTKLGTYFLHSRSNGCSWPRVDPVREPPGLISPSNLMQDHRPHPTAHGEPKGTGGSACFTHQLYYPYISLCNPTLLPLCTALKLLHSWREVPLCQLVPTCPIPPTLGSPDSTQLLHAPYSLPGTIVKIP